MIIPSYPAANHSAYAVIASRGPDTFRDSTRSIVDGNASPPSSAIRSACVRVVSHRSNACRRKASESSDGRMRCTAQRIRSSGQPCTYSSPSTGWPSAIRSASMCGHDVITPPPRMCMVRERGEYQHRRPFSFGCTIQPGLVASHPAYSDSIGSMHECYNVWHYCATKQSDKMSAIHRPFGMDFESRHVANVWAITAHGHIDTNAALCGYGGRYRAISRGPCTYPHGRRSSTLAFLAYKTIQDKGGFSP